MTIDEAIAKEKEEAKRLRKIIETGYDGEISIEAIFCDDTDAIKEAYERFENCAKRHEQLAEWLEDYIKMLIPIEQALKNEYNKAIDDLRNELKNHYTEYNIDCVLADTNFYSYTTACNYLEDYIDEIAKQLKEGGENE